jgi:SAM-dependent methyltransferase
LSACNLEQGMNERQTDRTIPGLGPGLYAEWRAVDIGVITDRLEQAVILELAGNVAGVRALDVGCCDGELALELCERGAQVTGVDASLEMIETAWMRAKHRTAPIAFEVAAAEQLPFASERFDIIVAVTILCFVQDAAPVFRKMAAHPAARWPSSANGARGRRRAASGRGADRHYGSSPRRPPSLSNSIARNASSSTGSRRRKSKRNSRQSMIRGLDPQQICSGRRSPCPSMMR